MKALEEAIKDVKAGAKAKFTETVELHANLTLDIKQADQTIRVPANLPHGSGKDVRVAVMATEKIEDADINLTEADLVKLEKSEIKPKADFDVLIVEPKFMAKFGKLGPILGPAGVMPNPKTGTVTEKVDAAVKQFKKGKVELRNEPNAPIIHVVIGKVDFTEKQLAENFMEVYSTLRQSKPVKAKPDWIKNIYISSTMGKGVQVDLANL